MGSAPPAPGAWRRSPAPSGQPCGAAYFAGVNETSSAAVQVMSTLSPTLTVASAFLSSTRELYCQLFGPVNVIDGTFGSIAVIVAVMVRCIAAVAPGFLLVALVTPALSESTAFSPGCLTRSTM